jgi:hypothetical protein
MRGDEISNAAEQLATDLDKAGPTGEVIVQRILTAQVLLQKENAELKAQVAPLLL